MMTFWRKGSLKETQKEWEMLLLFFILSVFFTITTVYKFFKLCYNTNHTKEEFL